MAIDTSEAKAAIRADDSRKWWQWVLMYPAFAVALVGAVPQFAQWISALRIGAPPGSNVADLKAQAAAWERNLKCLAEIERIKPASGTPYAIDLLICPGGDILVTLIPTHDPRAQTSRWILTGELLRPGGQFALIPSAVAQAAPVPAPQATRVVAVKKVNDLIVRRVLLSDSTCEDQTINAYTGRLVGTKRAPCNPF